MILEDFNIKPLILIRVDATKDFALGHLKRCISLSNKLREKNIKVVFFITKDDFSEELLKNAGFNYICVNCGTEPEDECALVLEAVKKNGAKIIIIDSYKIDKLYRKRLIDNGVFVVSIDDIADKEIPSHMIINGNLNAENLKYTNNREETSFFLGIKYLILGKDYWGCDKNIFYTEEVENILITMGGIDHYDLTTKILCILDKIKSKISVTTIIGPYYVNMDSINKQAGRMKKEVRIINSPSSLFPYMKECSMAFSAGGQTLYELAVLKRPTIGITLWENQAGNVGELSKIGAIKGIVYIEGKIFEEKLTDCFMEVISKSSERKRMVDIASSLVDGEGAERVSEAILKEYEKCITKK